MANIRSFSTTRPLFGQTALITGASRGIGAAIATTLAKAGANIAVNYLTQASKAQEIVSQCELFDIHAIAVAGDVSKASDVDHLFAQTTRHIGPITILVNNAGKAQSDLFIDTSEKDFEDLIGVNLKGPFLCTKKALPAMLQAQQGRIINISSIWGMVGGSCEVAYSAAKGGVIAFTKALAKELGSTGITVNAVAPGAISTDMMSVYSEEDIQKIREETPLGRLGTPEDVAHTVLFLASPESSFLTGQIISPNGGLVI